MYNNSHINENKFVIKLENSINAIHNNIKCIKLKILEV